MFRKETLSNGVRIITEKIPYVRSASIGFWVGTGSRDEDDTNNGMAHFIEHMLFKGTDKRSAREIAEVLDAVGGQLNAFTSREYTCYYARVLDEHINVAIDLLTDMFFNSSFKEEDVEREKNVIIEEIKMYEDAPDEMIHDLFASTLWTGHALGQPVIGCEEIVRGTSRSHLLAFKEKYYSPDVLVVAAAGNIEHDNFVAKIAPYFAGMTQKAAKRQIGAPTTMARVSCRKKETEQVHLCLGTPGLPTEHEQMYVLHLLNSILGGGISSRLFQEIREERGLAYSIFTYHNSYRDAGLFSVYAGLSRDNLNQVLDLISIELRDVRKNGVSADELFRAKEQLKGSILLGLESVSSRMTRLGKSEISLNRVITIDEVIDKIEKVSPEDVKVLAGQLITSDNIVVTSIGPDLEEDHLKVYLD